MRQRLAVLGLLWIWIFATGLSGSSPVTAADDEPSAEQQHKALLHFKKGQARFDGQEYLLAVEHFKISYEITGSPEILFNIAKCYEEANENEQAVVHYQMYLEVSSGEDAKEVEQKIQLLGGDSSVSNSESPDSKQDSADDGEYQSNKGIDEKIDSKVIQSLALELAMGPGFVVLSPDTRVVAASAAESTKHNYFSIDILAHFFLNDWFAISGILALGPYIEGSSPFISRDAKSHVGLGIGIGMKKKLKGRASLFTNILVIPCAIKREAVSKRATWLAFDIRVGLHIALLAQLELNFLAAAQAGPAFVISPTGTGDWETGVLFSVGPRAGITYTF